MLKTLFLYMGAIFLSLNLVGCTFHQGAKNPQKNQSFVTVEGQQFKINGKPYRYAGANYWYGSYLGANDKQRLQNELTQLKNAGINNLRVLAISESSDLVRAISPTTINETGEFNEALLVGLDYLLDEMQKRDMKAVLYLTNYWQWSGGMTQYLRRLKGTPTIDPDVTGRWNDYMESSADFYRCKPCQVEYQNNIKTIVTRTNTLNGKRYNDDATIMSWQLANEPRSGGDTFNAIKANDYVDWVDQTAGFIKTLAPRQLVSTGNEGLKGSQEQADIYLRAHGSSNIDYLTAHLWIKNWGWFDIHNADKTFPQALKNAKEYLAQHVAFAKKLNKPIVLEEFGAERDDGALAPNTPTTYRDNYYQMVFEFIETNPIFAGSNIWAYGGSGRAGKNPEVWAQGDDLMGDPPQEPQGLNSVFNTDTSTLDIVSAHAKALAQ